MTTVPDALSAHHQAGRRQNPNRVARSEAADVELFAQLEFGRQPCADRVGAVGDAALQLACDLQVARLSVLENVSARPCGDRPLFFGVTALHARDALCGHTNRSTVTQTLRTASAP